MSDSREREEDGRPQDGFFDRTEPLYLPTDPSTESKQLSKVPKRAWRNPVRRQRRRRRRRIVLAVFAALLLGITGAAGVLYTVVDVPTANDIATNQVTIVNYADGTEMSRLGAANRINVPLSTVPEHVQYAVLSAEDRTFFQNPGFDVKGIARAAWHNIRGEGVQGGSTITQQYVKNAFLNQDRTFARKLRELVISIKIERKFDKDQILEWYLNTIYYGRGAYGIEAAAETFFGKHVEDLTVSEGAVLAANIRGPSLYDPIRHPDSARSRWEFVVDGMVEEGWLTDQERQQLTYPQVRNLPVGPLGERQGPEGHIIDQVREELARAGFDESRINREGLRVQTTIDKASQEAAISAINEVFAGQPENLRQALVAIEPGNGKVRAYYGGKEGAGFDYAQAWRQPGSSFKPLTLATALEQSLKARNGQEDDRISVYSEFDGSSPRQFNGVTVHNDSNEQCPRCTLLEATKRSINTIFYDLAIQVGPENVADLARRVGVPETRPDDDQPTLQDNGNTDGSIGIGRYEIRPIDQASIYATIAAGGLHNSAHFVERVTDPQGNVLYEHADFQRRAIDPKVANDVTVALEPIAAFSGNELADGRASAAKTGTAQLADTGDNRDAWMAGFTSDLATAVWVGSDGNDPLYDASGEDVYGSGLPGRAWQAFMNRVLSGRAVEQLPTEILVKGEGSPTDSGPAVEPDPSRPSPGTEVPPSAQPSNSNPPIAGSTPPRLPSGTLVPAPSPQQPSASAEPTPPQATEPPPQTSPPVSSPPPTNPSPAPRRLLQ